MKKVAGVVLVVGMQDVPQAPKATNSSDLRIWYIRVNLSLYGKC